MDALNHFISMIPSPTSAAIGTIAIVVEFALRLIPSQKPLSILHAIGAGARLIGQALEKIADLSDKILPQNVTPPSSSSQ